MAAPQVGGWDRSSENSDKFGPGFIPDKSRGSPVECAVEFDLLESVNPRVLEIGEPTFGCHSSIFQPLNNVGLRFHHSRQKNLSTSAIYRRGGLSVS